MNGYGMMGTLVLAGMLLSGFGHGVSPELEEVTVYTAGEAGYHTFRIPAVLKTVGGDLLAFAEGRKGSRSDTGIIDLVLKRSHDGGRTWSPLQVVWSDGNTCGNPCPVLDESTGTIHLLMTHNRASDHEPAIIRKTAEGTRTVWVSTSTDEGVSWDAPWEITDTVKDPAWGWYATGPGVGIQLRNGPYAGRLVVPCDFSYDDPDGAIANGPFNYGSHVIYSDDRGATWHLGGQVRPLVNECQVVELADGNGGMLLDMRAYFKRNRRAHARSTDGGMTWSEPVDHPDLIEPVCQASLIRYSWLENGAPGCLLFANPASTDRVNMTVRLSYDDGTTWPRMRTVWEGPSAYSCLVRLADSHVGLLYERGEASPYEVITFVRFALSWLEHAPDAGE